MILTGMIFQFNKDSGEGLIMSSKGATNEFSASNWIDTSCEPSVGLKVSFEGSDTLINIEVLKDESISIVSDNKKYSASDEQKMEEFSSVDEYIEHFKSLGYKLAKDTDDGKVRTASLRRFLEDGHGEMIITSIDSKITVKTMVNGKEVK
ncbi:MAG: hypothetical protein COA44_06855 [Arcobacter sp.]|nr:MAG: hypothetical protein COA44_06855 [Arcobacter sp.]